MMSRFSTLKRRTDFDHVFQRGKRTRTSTLIIIGIRRETQDGDECRFGFQIRKKLGNAVTRNKLRRQLKAMARQLANEMARSWDFVVIAQRRAIERTYAEIERDFTRALGQLECGANGETA